MKAKYARSLFIFRRDLRLSDNTGLLAACAMSSQVCPVFFFDPRQIKTNTYKSTNAVQFMLNSLRELDQSLRAKGSQLFCWEGMPEKSLAQVIAKEKIEAVYVNRDYTPFSIKRDESISNVCTRYGVAFHSFDDALLVSPGKALKSDGKPYSVFTPFFVAASKVDVPKPRKFLDWAKLSKRMSSAKDLADINVRSKENVMRALFGGRAEGLRLIRRVVRLEEYEKMRNFPAKHYSTMLSAHNKFGTVSIREVYHAIASSFGIAHPLIRQLYWRDFFSTIGFYFPHVFSGCYHSKFDNIKWDNNSKKFKTWCDGLTGFPIVDAGMRELNITGLMHNRVRMIAASFLVKDLLIDWRWGEKYFAQKLIDYDPAVNNGNWQWVASTGCDAQPYFRIFNPWRQQLRFDPECSYIRKWVPELANLSNSEIHSPASNRTLRGYPFPMLDHTEASAEAEEIFTDSL